MIDSTPPVGDTLMLFALVGVLVVGSVEFLHAMLWLLGLLWQ